MAQPTELEILDATRRFMDRVDLKGTEVPTFNICLNYLIQKIQKIQQEEQNKEPFGGENNGD